MAACLSPVNLSAPMSAFFLKPAGSAYIPFSREIVASSVATRQPRGPPALNATTTRHIPAPVSVAKATTSSTSWRDRVASGPAEMPTPPNTPKSSPTFKSGKRKGRRSGSQSPKPMARTFTVDEIAEASVVASTHTEQVAPSSPAPASVNDFTPASRVYDMTLLLNLSASPLVGVTPEEYTHMEELVWNHTWRRGPHQSVSPPSSRSSSRASSPAPSSARSASPAPIRRLRRGEQRRASSRLREASSDDCDRSE